MNAHLTHIACVLLNALCVLGTGCTEHRGTEGAIVKPPNDMRDLETKVALSLPNDAVLLNATDGGGRDPSYGFYEWLVFSPSSIEMPRVGAPGGKDYFSHDLANSVKLVETRTPRRRIAGPQAAFGSEWENEEFIFDGTLVRSSEGDYLVVQRFRKK